MIASDSKSYPFLALAQRLNVDYGDVLSYSDSRRIAPRNWTWWHHRAHGLFAGTLTGRAIVEVTHGE